jgi:hypothetical protein
VLAGSGDRFCDDSPESSGPTGNGYFDHDGMSSRGCFALQEKQMRDLALLLAIHFGMCVSWRNTEEESLGY